MTIFKEMNKYPVIFIGSGISKRYLKNYPTWNELLEIYWKQINTKQNYYSYLNNLKKEHEKLCDKDELTHKINTIAAEYIEKEYNELFNVGKIKIPDLTPEKVYKEDISPFKFSICAQFSNYELRDDINLNELNLFKQFLKNSKIIITTNYDPFIEDLLNQENIKIKKYIGNKGFFDETVGYSELYKIHGDVSDPHSIIINEKDYKSYDDNSILISAKILSNIINTQIIFLGYSLSDRNIKKLLQDFSSQFPKEDDRKSAKRIIVVQYDITNQEIEPIHSSKFGVPFVEIKTNNFKEIYERISKIDEGLSPYELLRYQKIIKNLIANQGETGNLDKILVSPSDLENLEESLMSGKNLVVAIGDKKWILTNIDPQMYIEDYMLNNDQISLDGAINTLTTYAYNTWMPFSRRIKKIKEKNLQLSDKKKNQINRRIKCTGKLDDILDGIDIDKINDKKIFNSIKDIQSENFGFTKENKLIIKNIKNIPIEEMKKYILGKALEDFRTMQNTHNKTILRKMFCAYDLLINGDIELI